ncbi:MAG TPA: bifunctional DNA-binding transcriptional regulator/O6-methylguanine-DNA methyltransferase Ada [Verrucomicrobiae bacterium]|nr:bifunctional DNA-binding transcriptional regulator/O6-methylguanine-DNA methyltransferase Ada [Verrucomicrobiae bacterium]
MSLTQAVTMPGKIIPTSKSSPRARVEDRRWLAVLMRDALADGEFVYAVESTGVYCRPSCASRKPKRKQVKFFELPEAAEQAGFRACKRCLPRRADARNPLAEVVAAVCREIERQILSDTGDGNTERLKLSALSREAGMSPHQLQRAFRNLMDVTPRQYADAQKMKRLKSQLRKGNDVTTALYEAGFGSSSRLYERAPSQLGMTPATYRQGGAGMEIQYTLASSPLGRMLVAATSRGISALYLGDSDVRLEAALHKEYPRARIRKGRNGLENWVSAILAHLKGREPNLELPTDVQATAFQRRVWEELRRIPYGSTKTYGEVAKSIGKPKAVRAVARACATNPTSVVVPCHRVIGKNGNPAGYRWGLERKEKLLAMENRGNENRHNP